MSIQLLRFPGCFVLNADLVAMLYTVSADEAR